MDEQDQSPPGNRLNTATSPFVDESLGRGLARETVRRIKARMMEAGRRGRGLSERPRPSQRLKENTQNVEYMFRGLLAAYLDFAFLFPDEEDPEPFRIFFVWDVTDTATGLPRLVLVNLPFSRRTGDFDFHALGIVVISEHALQRVYQRLRTTEIRKAMRELGDAAATLWIHLIRQPELFEPGKTSFAVTPHGMAYAKVDLDTNIITFTTWIDEDKLREDQRAVRFPGAPAKDFGVRFYSGAPHLPTTGQVPR
jgi:hypothetical protein